MPPEDITLGELARRIADIKDAAAQQNRAALEEQRRANEVILNRLDKLVSTEVHERDMRRVDERFREIADDIGAERESRKELEGRINAAMEKTANWVRVLVVGVLIPIGMFVVTLLQAKPS